MVCATEAEAKRVYGEDGVLIAAMGAVAKSNGDVRPLHDGTHAIGLNNKIVVLDRLEVPGPAEIKEAVALAQECREAVFGVSADISQAHRRVRIRKCDWGRSGCKSSSSSKGPMAEHGRDLRSFFGGLLVDSIVCLHCG